MISHDLVDLEGFDGTARLFPLPNVVLFPSMVQALHVFEPRYRQMTADALAGDRRIALVLLRPGWEAAYEARPALYSIACLGKVLGAQRLPDGRYNLQLRGLSRIRIVREIDNAKLYRSATVELVPDCSFPTAAKDAELRRLLLERVPAWCSSQGTALNVFTKLLHSDLSISAVCDIISYALPLDLAFKQSLLEQPRVEERLLSLLDHLAIKQPAHAVKQADDRQFPPHFSSN